MTHPSEAGVGLREQGLMLASELSQLKLEDTEGLRPVNEKMKRLVDVLIEVKGKRAEKAIEDFGMLNFVAGDPEKDYAHGRMSTLVYEEKAESGKQVPKVVACIDRDGGSMLMEKDGQLRNPIAGSTDVDVEKGWMSDTQYAQDLKFAQGNHPSVAVQANRLREIRMAAKIIDLLLRD